MRSRGIGLGIPLTRYRSGISQYLVYPNTQTTYSGVGTKITFTDGITDVRKRIVVGVPNILYIDITKTPAGFTGVEGVDWEWIEKINLPNQGLQFTIFRDGSRNGTFRRDAVLDATGFAGAENINWEQLATYPGAGVQTTFRDGVRSTAYVIDKAMIADPVSPGVIGVDWENLITRKIP